jgi:hypothetical protein
MANRGTIVEWFRRNWPGIRGRLSRYIGQIIFLVGLAVIASFAFVLTAVFLKIINSEGFGRALPIVCDKDAACQEWTRHAMVLLIVPLMIIPVLWYFALGRSWLRSRRQGAAKTSDFYLNLATILLPYFVLGLGMLLELHKLVRAEGSVDSIDAVGAIAGIMILFALTQLGGFVFYQLPRSQREIEDSLRDASRWLQTQEQLSESRDYITPAPAAAALKMLGEWATLYNPRQTDATNGTAISPLARRVRDACVSTLLHTYGEEEHLDISGKLPLFRIPHAVRPPGLEKVEGIASFIATNVGYYATFLENLVPRLGEVAKFSLAKPCMAVVTYVTPAHWWNWPTEIARHDAIYEPVVRYWEAQALFAKENGRIFRKVLVAQGETAAGPLLTETDELVKGLGNGKLCFFIDPDKKRLDRLLRSGSIPGREDDLPGRVRKAEDIVDSLKEKLAYPIQHARNNPIDPNHPVYWIVDFGDDHPTCICGQGHAEAKCMLPVRDVYRSVFHPKDGRTEVIAVSKDFLVNPMNDQWASDASTAISGVKPGLGNCSDIMFLGVSRSTDIWDHGDAEWGCALMATMGPKTETMFLTIVHQRDAVNRLWLSVKNAFNAHRHDIRSVCKIPERGLRE